MSYKDDAKASRSAKMKSMTGSSAVKVDPSVRVGPLPEEPAGSVPMAREMAKPKAFKKSAPRLDKRARGGRTNGKTTVNVIVAPKPGGDGDKPVAMPMPPMPMPGGPLPGPGPGPMIPPPGGPIGPIPQGGMPMARKYGGRIPHTGEAKNRTEAMKTQYGNKKGFKTGGRVHSYPKMEAGAGNGEGRLEKVEKYGRKARP